MDKEHKPVSMSVFKAERSFNRQNIFNNYKNKNKADLRLLPYPFENYLTLSNDADNCTIEGMVSIAKIIREKYGLPISDSFFPHYNYIQGMTDIGIEKQIPIPTDFGQGNTFDFEKFIDKNAEWLSVFYNGGIDTVHGWLLRNQMRIAKDLLFPVRDNEIYRSFYKWLNGIQNNFIKSKISLFIKIKDRISRIKKRIYPLTFVTPNDWNSRVPPRYLVFNYKNPTYKSVVYIRFMDGRKKLAEIELDTMTDAAPETSRANQSA